MTIDVYVGELEHANGSSREGPGAPCSKGHAAIGQPGSGQLGSGELGTAEQLRAKLGDSLLAYELVGHLCCPITEAKLVSWCAHVNMRNFMLALDALREYARHGVLMTGD